MRLLYGARQLGGSILIACAFALPACGAPISVDDANQRDGSVAVTSEALSAPPDPECAVATFNGHEYWFCGANKTWSAARTRCQSQGMDLAHIDSSTENAFVLANARSASWFGTNDQTTEGAWRWSDDNAQFWSGAAGGSPVGGLYANWKSGQPDNASNQDCGAIETSSPAGKWSDRACTESLDFVCERALSVGEPGVECVKTGPAGAPWPSFRRCLGHQAATSIRGPRDTAVHSVATGGDVESSPVITADGTLIVGSYDTYVYAFNPDLTLKWRFKTNGQVRSSPALAPDGTIVVGSSDGKIYALNPDGTQKWTYTTGGPVRSSPAIAADGSIYVGSDDHEVYALTSLGALRWRHTTIGVVRSSPAISPDGTIYVGSDDWSMVALLPSGTVKWTFIAWGPVTSSPAIGPDGTIYVGSYDGYLYALEPGTGAIKWWYQTPNAITSSPAIAPDGSIVFGNDDGIVRAVYPSGSLKWSRSTGGAVLSSPAIDMEGVVYIGSNSNSVYALAASNGNPLWTFATGGDVIGSPAIGDALYVGSYDNKFYRLGTPDACPADPNKVAPGACGCGMADVDTDGDQTADCVDACPFDATHAASGALCQLPACNGSTSNLTLSFECVLKRTDGVSDAVYLVHNNSACKVEVPVGSSNTFTTGNADRGQGTLFLPGNQRVVISPIASGMSWRLGSITAAANPSGPACQTVTELGDGPVVLTPSVNHGTGQATPDHAQTTTVVDFTIPPRVRVETGNAGNGTATLSFRDASGALVNCTYRGGSSVASPTTDLDFARGLFWNFQSCSNGLTAGSTARGTSWDLTLSGGDPRFGTTMADVHLGPGCGGKLPPALLPEEVVQLRQGFNWSNTTALPETMTEPGVAQPVPAMHYALIYLDSDDAHSALRTARVHFRTLPLFAPELERFRDQCGNVDTRGDGQGQFVYALLPARAYNLIRNQARAAIAAGTEVAFKAVILRPVPDAAVANANGTLSWRAMAASSFHYFDEDTLHQPFFDDLVELIGDAIEGAVEAGTAAVGWATEGILGTAKVRLRFDVLNRDPGFLGRGRMFRHWGPMLPLTLHGAQVELKQWTFGSIPSSHWGNIDTEGRVTLTAAKDTPLRDSGICVHLETAAAQISEIVTEEEKCDFTFPLPPTFTGDFPAGGGVFEVRMDDARAFYLAQATDGRDYMQHIVGAPPEKQAEIAVGFFADTIGSFQGGEDDSRAFVGCLDYNALKDRTQSLLNLVLGSAAAATAIRHFGLPVLGKDIFLPIHASTRNSRGAMTHEYGHYVMCDAFNRGGALRYLYETRVLGETFGETPDDVVGIAMESFADFFASQVVSGVNYPGLFHASDRVASESMMYCTGPDCLERNFRGIGDGNFICPGNQTTAPCQDDDADDRQAQRYRDRIARHISTYHDAFDHDRDWRLFGVPTNADALQTAGATLGPPPRTFLTPFAVTPSQPNIDDRVTLSGSAIEAWLGHLTNADLETGIAMQDTLNSVMAERLVSWCDRCELFALHDPDFDPTGQPIRRVWEQCNNPDTELFDIVGPSPDPGMRYNTSCDPCAAHEWSDDNGICQNCDFPRRVNPVTNTCEDCPADATVDLNALVPFVDCSDRFADIQLQSNPNDVCPDEFWLDIQNIQALGVGQPRQSSLELSLFSFSNIAAGACSAGTTTWYQRNFRTATSGSPLQQRTNPAIGSSCVGNGYNGQPCPGPCMFRYAPFETLTPQMITDTGLTRMMVQFSEFQSYVDRSDIVLLAPNICQSAPE